MMTYCIACSLALLTLLQAKAAYCTMEEAFYVKVRVPESYIFPRNGKDEKSYGTKTDCSFGCTFVVGEEECTAFYFQKGECVMATLNTTFPYVPSYLRKGIDVMVRRERVLLNDKPVPHLGTLWESDSDLSLTNSSSGFGPVVKPIRPKSTDSTFGHASYKGGLLVCGSETARKCWYWTFHTGTWEEMPGTLSHNHFYGALVVVGDTMWMIMGRPADESLSNPTKKVETYDLRQRREWTTENDADVINGILIVGGKYIVSTTQQFSYRTYVLDTLTKTYTPKSNLYSPWGINQHGCATKPSNPNNILCAGGYAVVGGTGTHYDTIREFNTLIEDWEPEDDDKDHLPVQASANLMAINGELFAIVQGDDVYRYKDGEDPAWELVRSNVKFASKRNYVYSMLYHKFV